MGPGDGSPPGTISVPAIRADTFILPAGGHASILPPGSASASAVRVLSTPITGSVTVGPSGELKYQASDDGYGDDMLTYEFTGDDGRSLVVIAAIIVAGQPSDASGASVIQQAVLPPAPLEERVTYQGADLADPRILALRPLVAEILAAYPPAKSALDTARVLRDWLARTAIHPYPPLHPDGTTSNISVLPVGTAWSDVNALYHERYEADSHFWTGMYQDGPQMLDSLLGSVAGPRAGTGGMMERVGPARYRIRSLDSYRFVLCSYQSQMLIALWGAAGLHGMMVPTLGHDGSAVFVPELRNWIYMDPTYNEEYHLDGRTVPLTPFELVTVSTAGRSAELRSISSRGPHWDPSEYAASTAHPAGSYVGEHPEGFIFIGSQLNNAVTTPFGVPVRHVQIANEAVAAHPFFGNPASFRQVAPAVAFPDLGVGVERIESEDAGIRVRLASSLPGHARFEKRVAGGEWVPCAEEDLVPHGTGMVEYRSLDAVGTTGIIAIVET